MAPAKAGENALRYAMFQDEIAVNQNVGMV